MAIDEIDYGNTRAMAKDSKDKLEKMEPKLESMSRKVDLLIVLISLNLVGGLGSAIYTGKAQSVLLSVQEYFINNTEAYDYPSATEHRK